MRAAVVQRLEGPDGVEIVDVAEPDGDDGIVVDVVAAGVAFPDVLLARGLYQVRPDPPFTLGVECAGVVRSAPAGTGFAVGDPVVGFGFGCLAERVALPPESTFAKPAGMDYVSAGSFVLNYHTAHVALHRRGGLRSGETVLVHGAGGGLGSAVVQVAAGAGARVLATASTADKRALASRCGATEAFDSSEDWVGAVRATTDGRGVDVVADVVGGDVFDRSIKILAPEGRLLVLGFTSGQIPEVKVNRLLLRNASVVGVGWGALLEVDPSLGEEVAADLERLHRAGYVGPVIDEERSLEEVPDALAALERRTAVGKIAVRIAPEPSPG